MMIDDQNRAKAIMKSKLALLRGIIIGGIVSIGAIALGVFSSIALTGILSVLAIAGAAFVGFIGATILIANTVGMIVLKSKLAKEEKQGLSIEKGKNLEPLAEPKLTNNQEKTEERNDNSEYDYSNKVDNTTKKNSPNR